MSWLAGRRASIVTSGIVVCSLVAMVESIVASTPAWRRPLGLVAAVERGAYVARDARSGNELWRTSWVVERVAARNGAVVNVREEGSGRRGRPTPTTWIMTSELNLSEGGERFSSIKEIRDPSGHVLEIQRRDLKYPTGEGTVTTDRQEDGKRQSTTFSVTDDTIPTEILSTYLRALPDAPGREMRFRLATRDGQVIPMAARIVGEETTTTPAGEFRCYKTELSLTGARGVVARLALPKLYMWHGVDPPHFWVKYQGPDGGLGSAEIVMELVKFEAR